jgi:hypothetical protein
MWIGAMPYPVIGHNDTAVGLPLSGLLASTIPSDVAVVRAGFVARIVPFFDFTDYHLHTG